MNCGELSRSCFVELTCSATLWGSGTADSTAEGRRLVVEMQLQVSLTPKWMFAFQRRWNIQGIHIHSTERQNLALNTNTNRF